MAIKRVPVRAYLAHLAHYDTMWLRRRPRERPFDLDLAVEIIDALAAEKSVPKDVLHVLWQYSRAPVSDIKRIVGAGLPLWSAPGRSDLAAAIAFRDAVARAGGKGLLISTWMPLRAGNRKTLLSDIRAMGPIYRGDV